MTTKNNICYYKKLIHVYIYVYVYGSSNNKTDYNLTGIFMDNFPTAMSIMEIGGGMLGMSFNPSPFNTMPFYIP